MPRSRSIATNTRWRVLPDVVLYWKLLGDQYAVYNNGSGHTHVLDPIAALLIEQLTDQCYETGELVQRVAFLLNLEATKQLHTELEQTLWRLDELFLIESL